MSTKFSLLILLVFSCYGFSQTTEGSTEDLPAAQESQNNVEQSGDSDVEAEASIGVESEASTGALEQGSSEPAEADSQSPDLEAQGVESDASDEGLEEIVLTNQQSSDLSSDADQSGGAESNIYFEPDSELEGSVSFLCHYDDGRSPVEFDHEPADPNLTCEEMGGSEYDRPTPDLEGSEIDEPSWNDDINLRDLILKRAAISGIELAEEVNSAVGFNSLSNTQARVIALPVWLGSLFIGYKGMRWVLSGARKLPPEKRLSVKGLIDTHKAQMAELKRLHARQVQLEVSAIVLERQAQGYPSYQQLRQLVFQQDIRTEKAYRNFAKKTKTVPQNPSLFYPEWKGFGDLFRKPRYISYLERADRIEIKRPENTANLNFRESLLEQAERSKELERKSRLVQAAKRSAEKEFGVQLVKNQKGKWVLPRFTPQMHPSSYADLFKRLQLVKTELSEVRMLITHTEGKLASLYKPVHRGFVYKAGRFARSTVLGTVWLAGISAGVLLTADTLYIEFSDSEEMLKVKQKFEEDIQKYFTPSQ